MELRPAKRSPVKRSQTRTGNFNTPTRIPETTSVKTKIKIDNIASKFKTELSIVDQKILETRTKLLGETTDVTLKNRLSLLEKERNAIIRNNGSELVKHISQTEIADALLSPPTTDAGVLLKKFIEFSKNGISRIVEISKKNREQIKVSKLFLVMSAIVDLGLIAILMWLSLKEKGSSDSSRPACYQSFYNDKTQPIFTQVNCTQSQCNCSISGNTMGNSTQCALPKCDSTDGIDRGVSYAWGDLSQLAGATPLQIVQALPEMLKVSVVSPSGPSGITIAIYIVILVSIAAGMIFGYGIIFHNWPPIPQVFSVTFTLIFTLVQLIKPR